MEIALVNNTSVRIKGKQGSVLINPAGKMMEANGIILLDGAILDKEKVDGSTLVIKGSGEYEFGGIKVSGTKSGAGTVYSLRVDRIEILLGKTSVLEKEYSKLKEHNIVLLCNTEAVDPSFVNSLATNVVMFYGENAEVTIKNLANEGYRTESKYTTSYDKLPLEVEKILLA
jgi:hypothetical protein